MPQIFSLKMRDFLPFSDLLKRMQKKILIIDKEILIITRNSDQKILIIFKESLHSAGNLVNFHQKSIKVRHSRQMRTFQQKVHEFCPKLSCNSKTFLELGSQDPPLFAGLLHAGSQSSKY